MKITRVVSIIIVTFFSLVGSSDHALAQTANPPKIFLTKSLGNIIVSLDTLSGRFAVRCADGRSILFGSEFSNTSHISVKIGKRVYSNYWWIKRSVAPPNVYDLGKGTPEVLSDRLRYTWTVHNRDGDYAITQDLIPALDTMWNEALVQVSVRCLAGAPTTAGVTIQMDINAGGNDKAPITINGNIVTNETVCTAGNVPDAWTVQTQVFGKETITGRLTATDCVKPDRMVAGNWQTSGDLGIAVYGYGSVGHLIGDGAVFYEWAAKHLDVAGEFATATRLGIRVPPDTLGRFFGTEFFHAQNGYGVYFFHASEPTRVNIHQFGDNKLEGLSNLHKSWDTSFTIQMGAFNPFSCFAAARHKEDTLPGDRTYNVRITSDKPIGIQYYHQGFISALPKVMTCDTEFIYPGGHLWTSLFLINTSNDDMKLDLRTVADATSPEFPRIRIIYQQGVKLSLSIPPYGIMSYDTYIVPVDYRRKYWDYRYTSRDGAGMQVQTNRPAMMQLSHMCLPWYAQPADSVELYAGNSGHVLIPSKNDGGKEFVFIPFVQNYTPVFDLVRIIPFEDGTTVSFANSGRSFLLQAGEHLDTLLSQAEVIKSDKPMAIYQSSARTIPFTQRTDMITGSWVQIPPVEQWGKSYYSIAGANNIPAKWQLYGSFEMPWLPEMQFIRILKEDRYTDAVYLNGQPIDFSGASRVGTYSFLDIRHSSGFDIVDCAKPILVVTYGGFGTINTRLIFPKGYAYVPLNK
jgi:hypothetical protein